eukprot:600964-Rhodomonas_salina.2
MGIPGVPSFVTKRVGPIIRFIGLYGFGLRINAKTSRNLEHHLRSHLHEMRAFWALVAVLVFDAESGSKNVGEWADAWKTNTLILAARAINTAGEPCFKTSRDEDIVLKTCNGIEIQSAMCAKNVGEVDTLLDVPFPRPAF